MLILLWAAALSEKLPRVEHVHAGPAVVADKPEFELMAQSVIKNLTKPKWIYEHACAIRAVYKVGEYLGRTDLTDWVKNVIDSLIGTGESIIGYDEADYSLDKILMGRVLFDLQTKWKDAKYKTAEGLLRKQLQNQPRTPSKGFWHKKIYPNQMWLDGTYMGDVFYAQSQQGAVVGDVVLQFTLLNEHCYDANTGLLYHGWDESKKEKWSNATTGCSPSFWARSIGWWCMALVDALDFIKDAELISMAKGLVSAVIKYQDKRTGLWYQVMDQGSRSGNYLETSASAMFTYFLYKMLNDGRTSDTAVKDAAAAGWRGVLSKSYTDPDGTMHLSGICRSAGLGGNPYRNGTFEYYISEAVVKDDYKGLGAFILAGLEGAKYNKK
jgi:unsaturated rhamnogalacturonyl hydrolase